MHFINPFKGLRPIENEASSVSIPSTDHLSQEIIISHKKNNPWSYLNIFNPDSENLKSQNEVDAKAKEQFELMKNKSVLTKENIKSFYIYKISTKDLLMITCIFVVMRKFILKDLKKDLIK